MTDLGPLLYAVTDSWEPALTIAKRAGINARTAGAKLAALERQGFVTERYSDADRARVYRRGPNAAPATCVPAATVFPVLGAACAAHPQQRVGQVLVNACGGVDPFYITDIDLIEALRAYAAEDSTP